jgi:hypothetical protein
VRVREAGRTQTEDVEVRASWFLARQTNTSLDISLARFSAKYSHESALCEGQTSPPPQNHRPLPLHFPLPSSLFTSHFPLPASNFSQALCEAR